MTLWVELVNSTPRPFKYYGRPKYSEVDALTVMLYFGSRMLDVRFIEGDHDSELITLQPGEIARKRVELTRYVRSGRPLPPGVYKARFIFSQPFPDDQPCSAAELMRWVDLEVVE
jgi:hypothetical protein